VIYFVKNLKETFQYNKFRSILTGIGVFIGISAVIIILTISSSFSNNLVNKYATKTTIGLVNSVDSVVDLDNVMNGSEVKDNIDQVRDLPGVKEFSEAFVEETVDVYVDQSNVLKENVVVEFKDIEVTEGDSFKERTGNIVIIRNNEDFDTDYSIGDLIYVNNESYEIIGITDEVSETSPSLYFPPELRSMIEVNSNSISSTFDLVLQEGFKLDPIRDQVLTIMNSNLEDNMKFIDYSEETSKAIKETIGSISIFLVLIGTISLVVAGINVINIMYISALEKMNEVAIYRALGMRKKTVISLFLMEALVIVVVFAILGYLFGLLVAAIILAILDIPFVFSVWHMLLVLFISMILGLGAGIKPAINAANSSPASLLK
jgi:putative ABC transport system permease protein